MTKFINFWAPTVSQIEEKNRMKTTEYANCLEGEDIDLFTDHHSVLYFVVKKASWNKNSDFYEPEDATIKLHSTPPKWEIARRCFSAEIEEASVEIYDDECCINHGRIGAASVPVPLGDMTPKRLRNESWLLVAVLLHDYDAVFANFGEAVYEVSQTKHSVFTISEDHIRSMKMFLRRSIDKRKDIVAVFPIELEIKKRIPSKYPSVRHTVCAPKKEEILAAVVEQTLTEDQKKININSFFE